MSRAARWIGLALLGGEAGGGRLLDELLVPALQRAVAVPDDRDGTPPVAEHLDLQVPGPVEELLHEALTAAERGDGLAGRGLEGVGDLLARAGHRIPRPPPPCAALTTMGSPNSSANASASAASASGLVDPGASGAPASRAMARAVTLSPRASMVSGAGPIHVSPAASTARANSAFSDRNP